VAVGVRLDNRLDEDLGPDDAANEVEIGCERFEVELKPGRSGQGRQPRVGQPSLDRPPAPRG
jgi:hypothetical protein